MQFKKFLEDINPGHIEYSDNKVFGSGRTPELPDPMIDDITNSISGRITEIQRKKGKGALDRETGEYHTIVTVKTPNGVFTVNYTDKRLPEIEMPVTITTDRNGSVLSCQATT